jgi:propanol-preferring alcohol dehydrogenase
MTASIPETMRAMVLHRPGEALRLERRPVPRPGRGQVLLRVEACGVCRTDLHLIDGELPEPRLPVIPGHEIVGRWRPWARVGGFAGQRIGVPWLGWTCGHCRYCTSGRENLCDAARFTGYQIDGGYADYTLADARYCFPLAETRRRLPSRPRCCAPASSATGRCAWRAARSGSAFGAAAHIVAQVVRHQGHRFYAFTRPGDVDSQAFARQLGAAWAGEAGQAPPEALDAALIFAPAGPLVPAALKQLEKGGRLVCAGIHMSDIPGFPYADLWGERSIRSVANLTRQDGIEFLDLAPRIPVRTSVTVFPSKRPTPPWRSCGGARCRGCGAGDGRGLNAASR